MRSCDHAICSPEILSDEIILKQFHGNVQNKAARDEKINAHPVIKVTDLECVLLSGVFPLIVGGWGWGLGG
jgi:hypothetical protein